MIILMISCMFV